MAANVQLIYSEWNFELMVTQFRDMIGQKPDGIAMMGHPGDAALLPTAGEADAAGINLPVVSLCQQLVYKPAPLNVDTGSGFVTAATVAEVAELANAGFR